MWSYVEERDGRSFDYGFTHRNKQFLLIKLPGRKVYIDAFFGRVMVKQPGTVRRAVARGSTK